MFEKKKRTTIRIINTINNNNTKNYLKVHGDIKVIFYNNILQKQSSAHIIIFISNKSTPTTAPVGAENNNLKNLADGCRVYYQCRVEKLTIAKTADK